MRTRNKKGERMKVLYKFSRKGDGLANEDICGNCNQFAWVIDGATDVFQKGTFYTEDEVAWYVRQLNEQITSVCSTQVTQASDPKALIKRATLALYEHLQNDYDLNNVQDYMLPTFALAMFCLKGKTMCYYLLGDCTISYMHNGKILSLRDKRIEKFSKDNRKKLKEYLHKTNSTNVPLSLYQETRMKANTEGGYPIGMVSGRGIGKGITGEVSLTKGDKILIYSDGFLDYINNNEFALNGLFDCEKIEEEISRMYEFLNDSNEYANRPRPKKIDDSTLMLLEVD